VLMISHDIAVCARFTSRLAVVLAGETVESGRTKEVIASPAHPYSRVLVGSLSGSITVDGLRTREAGEGHVPVTRWSSRGRCRFADGCPQVMERCRRHRPALAEVGGGRWVRCFLVHDQEEPDDG